MARVSGTHEDDSMPIGLQKRGSTYWLRRRVPQDLVAAYGKAEIVKSLKTKDRAEAKRRLVNETYALEQEFDARRAELIAPSPVVNDAPAPAPAPAPAGMSRLQRMRGNSKQPKSLISVVLDLSESLDQQLEERAQRRPDAAAGNVARTVTERTGPKLSWGQLVELWAAERNPTQKTRKAHASIAKEFSEIRERVSGSTKADVLAYKEKLIAEGITAANLKTKLSRLKTLANYAHENGHIDNKIADGVRSPKPKTRSRVPYDDGSLQRLFSGPVHKGGARPAQGRGEAAYWLPLIALFTGARLEEIAGLLATDLVELTYQDESGSEQRAWFFKFWPNPDSNRSLKNMGSERTVPVHPELVRLGLIRYAMTQPQDGEAQLFPRLTAHASGKRAHKWGQWFGTYLRTTCGITDKRTVFHSFRHSLKDAGRESGVPEELQRAIMGHSPKDVAGAYGLGFSRRRIVEGMSQIKVPGLPKLEPQY